jgi:hypothetical protein
MLTTPLGLDAHHQERLMPQADGPSPSKLRRFFRCGRAVPLGCPTRAMVGVRATRVAKGIQLVVILAAARDGKDRNLVR